MTRAQQRKVLIAGGFTFHRGEAGSNYVIGLGKALQLAGLGVEYLGEPGPMARQEFTEFRCHSPRPGREIRGWRAALTSLCALDNRVVGWLANVPSSEFCAVVVYPTGDLTAAALARLRRLCLRKRWKMAVVVGEWQGFWQFGAVKLRHRVLAMLDSELQRRLVYPRTKTVIAISRYLERHYCRLGCETILVPPLIDTSAAKWHSQPAKPSQPGTLRLLFSGGWWRDRVDLMVEGVLRLRNEGHDVKMEFLGSSPADLQCDHRLGRKIAEADPRALRFHGNVPVEEVLPITATADFGVMLRDPARWAHACFPSKVPEFQALGVPILCNLTSNLNEVLHDGTNAMVVPAATVDHFVTTVKRALSLTPEQMRLMRERSRECAAQAFDCHNYADQLCEFVTGAAPAGQAKRSVISRVQRDGPGSRVPLPED